MPAPLPIIIITAGLGLAVGLFWLLSYDSEEKNQKNRPMQHRNRPQNNSNVNGQDLPPPPLNLRYSTAQERCVLCTKIILNDKYTIKCGHIFHLNCFGKYGVRQKDGLIRCPICREVVFRGV